MLVGVGVLGVTAGVLAWSLAAVIYFAAPSRLQNRFLALLLFAEGTYVGALWGFTVLADPFWLDTGFIGVAGVSLLAFPGLFMLFASTLPAPVTRLLQNAAARWVFGTLAVAGAAAWVLATERFIVHPQYYPDVGWGWDDGPWFSWMLLALIVTMLFSLVAAISYYRASPRGTITRRRAGMYVVAFAIHDVSHVARALYDPLQIAYPVLRTMGRFHVSVTTIVFVLVLAYGILKGQLFGIDLHLKASIRRGTVVVLGVAAIVGAAQAGLEYLEGQWGLAVAGLAAALVFLLLRPLERLGTKLSTLALPEVADTSDYKRYRQLELYREAVEGLLEDGRVTSKERRTLVRLQTKLAISAETASQLERDARHAFALR
ncbi:MAG TPA: hypothetical protein VGB18_03955 [Candidatus Thermoplasmatota archaeon]